jgi:hypothetical protein
MGLRRRCGCRDATEDNARVGGPMSDLTADIDGFAAVIEGTTPLARELGRANAHVSVRTRHMHVRFTHTRWLIQGGGGGAHRKRHSSAGW